MNYKARLYDPQTRRFLSPDPMNQYASPYTYVGNNPISLVDPSGMNGTKNGGTDPQDEEGPFKIEEEEEVPWWVGFDYFSGYSAANGSAPNRSLYGDATASHMADGFKTFSTIFEKEWDRNHPDFKILLYAGYTNDSYRASLVPIHDGTGNLIAVDFDETKLVPYEVYLNLSMPGGALPGEGGVLSCLGNTSNGVGIPADIGELAADIYKAKRVSDFNNTSRPFLVNPRIMNSFDKAPLFANGLMSGSTLATTANVLKGAGIAGSVVGVGVTVATLVSGNGTAMDVSDLVVNGGYLGAVALAAGNIIIISNPVGWAIGGVVVVYNGVRLYQNYSGGK